MLRLLRLCQAATLPGFFRDPVRVERSRPAQTAPLIAALSGIDIAPQALVGGTAEASVVRAIRAYLVEERGYPFAWIKASGYWLKGKADTTEKFDR